MASVPQELIDIVIDHTHDDDSTLFACSLVCKRWLPSTRYHLFHELWLSNARSNDRINRIVSILNSSSPSLIPQSTIRLAICSTHHVLIYEDDTPDVEAEDSQSTEYLFSGLAPHLKRFSSVTQLRLLGLITISISLELLASFSSITDLEIGRVVFRDSRQLVELVTMSPVLHALTVYMIAFPSLQSDWPTNHIPPSLQKLTIYNCGKRLVGMLLRWVENSSIRLEELSLAYPMGENALHAQRIINNSAESLVVLHFSVYDRNEGSQVLDLSLSTQLRILRIVGRQMPDICPTIVEIIASLGSDHLQELVLPMIDHYSLPDFTIQSWKALDQLLATDRRFSNLGSVIVHDNSRGPHAEQGFVTHNSLPLTFSRGIVEIKETL